MGSMAERRTFIPYSERPTRKQLAAVILRCREVGLTRSERIELTEFICGVSDGSLTAVTRDDVRRLLDALAGFQAIVTLLSQRPEAQAS